MTRISRKRQAIFPGMALKITTSSFTKDAIEYASLIESKVILIDGDKLDSD
jgi:restriction endonuclease Mrr